VYRLGAVLAIHLDPRRREPGQPDIPIAGSVGRSFACQHREASPVQEDRLVDLARRVQIAYGVRGKVPDHERLTSNIAYAPFIGAIRAPMPGILCSHGRSVLHRDGTRITMICTSIRPALGACQ
jgi:hypothetical protein